MATRTDFTLSFKTLTLTVNTETCRYLRCFCKCAAQQSDLSLHPNTAATSCFDARYESLLPEKLDAWRYFKRSRTVVIKLYVFSLFLPWSWNPPRERGLIKHTWNQSRRVLSAHFASLIGCEKALKALNVSNNANYKQSATVTFAAFHSVWVHLNATRRPLMSSFSLIVIKGFVRQKMKPSILPLSLRRASASVDNRARLIINHNYIQTERHREEVGGRRTQLLIW